MKYYIHEREDWPVTIVNEVLIRDALLRFHSAHGRLLGKLDALGFEVQNELLLSSVSDEIVTSFEIEGETLKRSSVRSSVAKRLGIKAAGLDKNALDHYTEGIVEMALDATQNFGNPLDEERLFSWHAALFPMGRSGIRRIAVGAFRSEKMEIVSGAFGKEKVHYKAPDPERVPAEMKKLLTFIEEEEDIDPYVKAGLSHLWFELIHPFDDGNGRIGRAVADLLLARAEGSPKRYYSISSQFLKERKAYYDELDLASRFTGDVTRWVDWFLGCLLRAVETSEEKIEKSKQKALMFERLRNLSLNERQVLMMNRIIEGFEGKLTAAKWAKICKCSHDTALRDIEDLISKGVLIRSVEGGRSTSYELI